MPKILLGVSSSFCANFLHGQTAYLRRNGFDVVILSGSGEEITALAESEGARLYTVGFSKTIAPWHDLRCLGTIIKILRKEKPDLIHAGNPKSGLLILFAAWLLGLQNRIFTLHGLVSDHRFGISKRIIRVAEKLTCRMAREVFVVSPSLLTFARQQGILNRNKGLVLGRGSCNGVDASRFRPSDDVKIRSREIGQRTGLSRCTPVIGFIGRLSGDKGIDLLFEAYNTLRKEFPALGLLLAGPLEPNDPFSPAFLRQMQQDPQVVYMGKLADVVPLYPLMDVLALCSYREGFGNVLIEAAAMEIPVVAPDMHGCRDALEDAVNGKLFQRGNVADLIHQLRVFLNDKDLSRRMGQAGRRFVLEHFQQETIWAGQLQIYRAILQDEYRN